MKNLNERKTGVKIFLGALLVLICGAMVLTLAPVGGIGTTTTSPNAVATVAGENITALEVRQQYNQQTQGRSVPPMLQGLYMQQVLDHIVFKRLLEIEAKRLGVEVTDEEITARIKELLPSAFVGGTWVGSARYAQEVESRTGMTVPQFEDFVRSNLLFEKFQNLTTAGITVSPRELEQRYRWLNEKVQLQYAELEPSDLESSINPSGAELKTYFTKNESKYQVPERRSAKYALLDIDQLTKNTKISDAEIQDYYQKNINDYKVQNRVHVEHILFNTLGKTSAEVALVKQQAEKVDEQAKHGTNFEDLAKKYSEDANTKDKGGDIGWIVAGQTVPAFEKVAFSLPKNTVSGVVQTPYGFDIIKVLDRETAHTKPLSQVRASIVATLTQQEVTQEQNDLSDKMSAAVRASNSQSIAAIAKEFNLETGETPLVSVTDPVGDLGKSPGLEDALFSLQPGQLSQPIAIDRGYVILSLDKSVPAHQGTLAEVHDRVLADYRKEESKKLAKQKAQELAKQVKGGAAFDQAAKSLGLALKTTEPVTRTGQIGDLGTAKELEPAFNMAVGQTGGPILLSGRWLVYQVRAKQGVNPADFVKAKSNLEEQIKQEKQSIAFEAFRNALEDRYKREGKLVYNHQNLKALMNQSSS